MAEVLQIEEIKSIPGADKICSYRVLGWWVIDQINKYKVGDIIIYCSIDSFIPSDLAPFLTKPGHCPKTYNGVVGEKLRTIKLRKAISQGLILPLSVCDFIESELFVGLDVSYPLGIEKWEPPPEFVAADARGNFPSYCPKSDQERCCSADTMLITDHGAKTIKEICESEFIGNVLSNNGHENVYKKIIGHSIMSRRKGWIKIHTKSGKELTVTENHKIFMPEMNCYREAKELKVGDTLKIC